MTRPGRFIALAFLFTAIAYAVAAYVPPRDPFAGRPDHGLVALDGLPLPVFADLKLRHIRRSPRFDIGVFGNSRSLDVGRRLLSLGNCSFFNFSVPSESLRFVVGSLERLHAIGKAPRLALISVDAFELQHYSNPITPSAPIRWSKAADDLRAGVMRHDIVFRKVLQMGWRHLWIETTRFRAIFNPESFFTGAGNLLSDGRSIRAVNQPGPGYGIDGSREAPASTGAATVKAIPKPAALQIDDGYLRYDLESLARLQKAGIRMVLYESPLEPKSARFYDKSPSAAASRTRRAFQAACRDLGLDCRTSTRLSGDDADAWSDYTHPPVKILGPYVNDLIRQTGMACLG